MFKSILPGKRLPADDEFTMITPGPGASNGKENQRTGSGATKSTRQPLFSDKYRGKKNADATQPAEMNNQFDKLLDDLQIPDYLRPRLLGMESTVKEAMLKGSHTLVMPQAAERPATPPATRGLRRVQSGSSLSIESPRPQRVASNFYQQPSMAISGITLVEGQRTRGMSMDLARPKSRGAGEGPKSAKDKGPAKLSPVQFVSQLTSTSSLTLPVELVKKLRIMLRNEPASWTQDFLRSGGYSSLLTRLNELLEVEWREEQHDDQLLHEVLRCVKALSTSSIGCFALRSSCPTPFVQLLTLLYSDKKPGEVATRQLIVDLLLLVFDLYPASSLPAAGNSPRTRRTMSEVIMLPHPHTSIFSLMKALLLTPAPKAAEAPETEVSPHEFIESLHKPRIYKTYLQELSDICRDYFWVFCHPNNTIWVLSEVDEGKVEKPKAPGGMTGGVEFEAMAYLTSHFRLLNAVSKAAQDLGRPQDHPDSAYQLHTDLFLSGLERILLIARKASATYYPTLHLEIARYTALATQTRYELPWTVSRLVGPPPATLARRVARPADVTVNGSAPSPQGSPTKRTGPASPALPTPRRVTPMRFD
ncbi:hypothetical protein PENSPDRAFT_644700 [Peniophora sp. CONT]|nr:hypothetical protein PENSPDRAFT_644700 [Peniophora sp. CONT]